MLTIDTYRTLSVNVLRKNAHTDQYLNFQSIHPNSGWLKPRFSRRADKMATKQNDNLSEQRHLRQCLNLCGNGNSIIDRAISSNKPHNSKSATSIEKNKCYVTLPYQGELSKNETNFSRL